MKDKIDLGVNAQKYHDYFNEQSDAYLKNLLTQCKSNLFKRMIMAIQEYRLSVEDQGMFDSIIG